MEYQIPTDKKSKFLKPSKVNEDCESLNMKQLPSKGCYNMIGALENTHAHLKIRLFAYTNKQRGREAHG